MACQCFAKIPSLRRTTVLELCFLVFSMLAGRSTSVSLPNIDGFISTSTDELQKDELIVDLPFRLRIFGEGKFNSIYINSVGAVSFAKGISTSKLDSITDNVIIFAPLLLLPDIKADVTIQFEFNDTEIEDLQQKFRAGTDELQSFQLLNALKVTWNEDFAGNGTGNVFEIVFANDDKERTFVLYDYVQVDRIEDEHGYAKAGIFAFEDGSVLCPHELEESGTEEMLNVKDFLARIDLPLICRSFNYSCNASKPTTADVQDKLAATFQDLFFETISTTEWLFYRFYLCGPRLTKPDGTVAIKETCEYDPDYYEYSWRPTSRSDVCSQEENANPPSLLNRSKRRR